MGAGQRIVWSLTNAALVRNSAGGSGGALAFTVTVQGVLCQHCHLQGNTAGLLGGALFSTAKELCVASRNQQVGNAWRCFMHAVNVGKANAERWQITRCMGLMLCLRLAHTGVCWYAAS
jgi:hypothetical protein